MTAGRPSPVIQILRRAALAQDAGGRTDGELLGGFVARRDESALEALIRRHGPMVLAVCRRVLGNESDAKDAFQAAFLVFVRKAASIRRGNWSATGSTAWPTGRPSRRDPRPRGGGRKRGGRRP